MIRQVKIFSVVFLVFSTLIQVTACNQRPIEHVSDFEAEIDAYVEPFLKAAGFSGALYIAKGGDVLLSKGYGMANYEWNISNTPQVKFQIASVSKLLIAR